MSTDSQNKLGHPKWVKYQTKFSTLLMREKVLTLFTGLFIIFYLSYVFLIEEIANDLTQVKKKQQAVSEQLQQANTQIDMLQQALKVDYTSELKAQIAETNSKLELINQRFDMFSNGFVSPQRMPELLRHLLVDRSDIKLIEMKVLPVIAIDAEQVGQLETETLFYEHSIQLTLQGGYFSLEKYLASVKNGPHKLLVKVFNYQVIGYPKAELTIEIATVSANEKFLAL